MASNDIIRSPDIERANRVPPGQHAVKDFPVLHHGAVPALDFQAWRIRVWGLVKQEVSLCFPEFKELPRVTVLSDIHCVTTWSRLDNRWEGVSPRVLAGMAQPQPEAKFAMVHGAGGFTANLSLDDLLQPDVVLADRHDGAPITPEHGAPVRLVVPRLYFWKSAKWVTGIELTERDAPGFWERNGYHMRGDPWKEERYGSGTHKAEGSR